MSVIHFKPSLQESNNTLRTEQHESVESRTKVLPWTKWTVMSFQYLSKWTEENCSYFSICILRFFSSDPYKFLCTCKHNWILGIHKFYTNQKQYPVSIIHSNVTGSEKWSWGWLKVSSCEYLQMRQLYKHCISHVGKTLLPQQPTPWLPFIESAHFQCFWRSVKKACWHLKSLQYFEFLQQEIL